MSNGGAAVISNNQIIQGAASQNYKLVDYGAEGLVYVCVDTPPTYSGGDSLSMQVEER